MDTVKTNSRFIARLARGGILMALCLLLVPPFVFAAGMDMTPPQITIVAPPKDSQIESGTPRIEVSCSDVSGIKTETIHLFVDRMEVTAKAIVEQEDVTGQTLDSPWHVSYTPEAALNRGKHEARFSVEDEAGNRAELGWNFEVTVGVSAKGVRINGSNTLRIDESPVREMTDTWDTTIRRQYGETEIRLNAGGQVTNYPGSETADFYSYQDYNFYIDDYSLGVYRGPASVVAGRNINASLDSELLEIGLTLKGAVAADTWDGTGGQYHGTAFSGQSGSSYAANATLYDMTGAGGDWRVDSGKLQIGTYYVDLNGSRHYQYSGLRGYTALGDLGILRFETIYGLCQTSAGSGFGWAFHWDKSWAAFDLGLDYTERQPDYPIFGSSGLIESSRGGLRTYAMRVSADINEKQRVSFDGAVMMDNLAHTYTATKTEHYITAGYDYHPSSEWSLSANYRGEFENTQSGSENENRTDQSFTFGMGRNLGTSKLKITDTLNAVRHPAVADTYDGSQIVGSWTFPMGENNLTPSVMWSYQQYADGQYAKTVDTRFTWDRRFYSDLPRSSITLFYRVAEESDATEPQLITYGILPAIYIKTGPNSTLTLVYNYNWYRRVLEDRAGIEKTINVTWKLEF